MNSENRHELLAALREQRARQQGTIVGLVELECTSSGCPVGQVRLHVKEVGTRLLQPPMRCCRCGGELYFIGLQ